RATPMQMWQSDICTIRLAGKNAYLIGFMDDHSRYLVGLEVYRSQTTENVLEVYRTAVGEYGTPKEMLTDNGSDRP
ncbi:MAG: DDE-type integrase/transposase/recombinase, partial [Verrucomicrobia bacterium]|nr:DDE-type integrase/transposase/recombinase [Verrucomicrobiota bacterium]